MRYVVALAPTRLDIGWFTKGMKVKLTELRVRIRKIPLA